jgi:hypothetical protein
MELPSVTRDRRALVISALIAVVAVVALAVVVATSRESTEPEPEPPPPVATPEPEPEPEPEPPGPVAGEYELLRVTGLSVHGRRVFGDRMPQDAPVEPDEVAVNDFVEAMVGWLDGHFTDLQDGGRGWAVLADVVGPVEVISLTDPDHPVAQARYEFVVWARVAPEWGRAAVELTLADGSIRTAALTFAAGEPPVLVAAEGEGAPPPTSPAGDEDEEEGS